ncbi:MAG: DNA polymerase IV [Candidatus Ancillula sp.]|nr:DNA polymerase IV [Candidatus Ancillula sp.]
MRKAHIAHIDINAFYASCEQLRHPEYRGKPVIVGEGKRAVVSAASYEARKYGIHSAMPYFQAKKLCPDGIYLKVDMKYYLAVSARVFDIFESFTYAVEKIGADEAFLDLAPAESIFGGPREIAQKIKSKIKQDIGLDCTIGIANSKSVAKIASTQAKPANKAGGKLFVETDGSGILVVEPDQTEEFLRSLPVKALWGVGKATQAKLANFGIYQVSTLLDYPKSAILKALGNKVGQNILDLASGIDSRDVDFHQKKEKSIGKERTLREDTRDLEILKTYLKEQSANISQTLKKHHEKAKTITLVLRMEDLLRYTRSKTLDFPTYSRFELFDQARDLLIDFLGKDRRKVRLIGISTSNFIPENQAFANQTLFDAGDKKKEKFDKLDKILNQM